MSVNGLKYLSLFCGCGGFDIGFSNAGFRCVGAFDIDPLAIQVHKENLNSPAYVHDLVASFPKQALTEVVDVLIAGPPCQGFSTAGKNDPDDPRNKLLLIPAQIAEIISPRVIVVENVMGVASPKNRPQWEALVSSFHTIGYKTVEIGCNAIDYGVPQERKRILLIAWNSEKELDIKLPFIQGGNLGSVLSGLKDVNNHNRKQISSDTVVAKVAKRIKPGQKLCNVRSSESSVHTWDLPEVFGRTNRKERKVLESLMVQRRRNRKRTFGDADPVASITITRDVGFSASPILKMLARKGYVRVIDGCYDLAHTFNGKYRRLRLDRPSPTVHTRFGDPRYFIHPTEDRGFTVREAARIQGFPDSFLFRGKEDQQYKMVGNAVPPQLATVVATYLRNALLTD